MTRSVSPSGKRVLVNSAAGGVGSWLVQLSRAANARKVIGAVSSEAKFQHVLDLGADAVVNYQDKDWTENLMTRTEGSGPDIIYEGTGGAIIAQGLAALAPRGEYVVYSTRTVKDFAFGPAEVARLSMKNQSLTGFSIGSYLTPEGLRAGVLALFEYIADGIVKPQITGRYPLVDVAAAHRALESRESIGKIVLLVDSLAGRPA